MDQERLRLEGEVVRAEQRVTVAREMAERFPTVPHAHERLRHAEEELKRARCDLQKRSSHCRGWEPRQLHREDAPRAWEIARPQRAAIRLDPPPAD